jgi:hypothetical protein
MYATHQTMWHPLHPQRTNHLTFMSKKNPLLVCPSPMNFQLSSTPFTFQTLPNWYIPYLLRYKVRSLARTARRTSNSIFNNARSLLRHPLGPSSKTLSLCSCLFQTRSTLGWSASWPSNVISDGLSNSISHIDRHRPSNNRDLSPCRFPSPWGSLQWPTLSPLLYNDLTIPC